MSDNPIAVCTYCSKTVRVIDGRYESHGSFPFFCRGTARSVVTKPAEKPEGTP